MTDALTVIDLENIHKVLLAGFDRQMYLPEEIPVVIKLADKLQKTVHAYQLQVAASHPDSKTT